MACSLPSRVSHVLVVGSRTLLLNASASSIFAAYDIFGGVKPTLENNSFKVLVLDGVVDGTEVNVNEEDDEEYIVGRRES